MTNWKEYKLGELIETVSKTFKFSDKKVVFLNTSDTLEGKVINHNLFDPKKLPGQAKKSIQPNDILYSEIRPANKRYAFVDFESSNYVVSTKLMVLRVLDDKIISPKYLYYFLTSDEIVSYLQMLAESRSGTFPQIRFEEVSLLDISLPPLNVQNEIVELVASLDDKIELNNKINQELENLAQTLFKQWFIDFEFPNENGEPYKSSGGEMIDSELGEIPMGWVVKSLDEIADYLNGLALQKFPAQEGEDYLPVIKIRELRQGITQASDKASTEVPYKYIIQNGDVLFAWSGSLMIDFWTNGEGALNQHLFKVTSENYPKWFYFYWTKHHLDEFIKIAESKATTMGHIQRKHLTEAKVTVPNSNHLNQFNDNFENLVTAIISNREENQELTTLRDTLLPKLISGELEAADVMAEKA